MKLTALLLPLALLGAACDIRVDDGGIRGVRIAEGEAEDVWTRTYTISPGGRVEVAGQNGEIAVRAAGGAQVEIRAERRVRAGSDDEARQLLAKLEMREEVAPDRVSVATVGEEGSWAPPGIGRRRADVRVRYDVRVPDDLTLVFRTENGGIRLENVNGRITATTTNGGVNGTDVTGSVTAETVNGGIRMELASITGDVRLATTNGGVRLDIPTSLKANLEATWVNGGINLDNAFNVDEPENRARRLSAPLNGGGPTISATTVNGGIRIRARGGPDIE
jgi:hypothetical protein